MISLRVVKASVAEKKYNPDQPRHPAGDARGGQWAPDGGAGSSGTVFYGEVPEELAVLGISEGMSTDAFTSVIRNVKGYEIGGVFENGKLINVQKGDTYQVGITASDLDLAGKMEIHNHWNQIGLSDADIKVGLHYRLSEIRAITQDEEYSLRIHWDKKETETIPLWAINADRYISERFGPLSDKFYRGEISLLEANREAAHLGLSDFVKHGPQFRAAFSYGRRRLP